MNKKTEDFLICIFLVAFMLTISFSYIRILTTERLGNEDCRRICIDEMGRGGYLFIGNYNDVRLMTCYCKNEFPSLNGYYEYNTPVFTECKGFIATGCTKV